MTNLFQTDEDDRIEIDLSNISNKKMIGILIFACVFFFISGVLLTNATKNNTLDKIEKKLDNCSDNLSGIKAKDPMVIQKKKIDKIHKELSEKIDKKFYFLSGN